MTEEFIQSFFISVYVIVAICVFVSLLFVQHFDSENITIKDVFYAFLAAILWPLIVIIILFQ